MAQVIQQTPVASIKVIITKKDGYPMVELRKSIKDLEAIRFIISCAFRGVPVVILPEFTDKMQSINSMIEKGIIYKEGEEYRFNF